VLRRDSDFLTVVASANIIQANIALATMSKRKPYYTLASLQADNSVGYLVKRCGVLMSQVAEERFASLSISFTQWLVLTWLNAHDGHISATRLSTEIGHDMGALTRVVDELERRGYVKRERSRRDRRAVEIAITATGRRQAQDARRVLVELLNQLVAPFSGEEVDTLIRLLRRLMLHLLEAAEHASRVPKVAARAGARKTKGAGT
jgi:DNA-binding MarR family transcriptional regulator